MEKHKVTVILTQTSLGDSYVATFPAFPAWATQGETVEEALHMAKEFLELNFEGNDEEYRELLEEACSLVTVISEIEVEVPESSTVKSRD